MSAAHGQAQRLHHHRVGINGSPNAVAKDDIALAGLITPRHQDAVLTSCLCSQMTGSSKGSGPSEQRERAFGAKGDAFQAKGDALRSKGRCLSGKGWHPSKRRETCLR